jgi:hypothetical protein
VGTVTIRATSNKAVGVAAAVALAIVAAGVGAPSVFAQQEPKPVPKDSMRVVIPGCTKGYVFTVGARTTDHPGNVDVPEGMHLRMNGPRKVINDIKAHEGSMIELTGLVKKGQYAPGVGIGGGVRVSPGAPPTGGTTMGNMSAGMESIDVEGWRQIVGNCPSR